MKKAIHHYYDICNGNKDYDPVSYNKRLINTLFACNMDTVKLASFMDVNNKVNDEIHYHFFQASVPKGVRPKPVFIKTPSEDSQWVK